jgi:hypothetical protein
MCSISEQIQETRVSKLLCVTISRQRHGAVTLYAKFIRLTWESMVATKFVASSHFDL